VKHVKRESIGVAEPQEVFQGHDNISTTVKDQGYYRRTGFVWGDLVNAPLVQFKGVVIPQVLAGSERAEMMINKRITQDEEKKSQRSQVQEEATRITREKFKARERGRVTKEAKLMKGTQRAGHIRLICGDKNIQQLRGMQEHWKAQEDVRQRPQTAQPRPLNAQLRSTQQQRPLTADPLTAGLRSGGYSGDGIVQGERLQEKKELGITEEPLEEPEKKQQQDGQQDGQQSSISATVSVTTASTVQGGRFEYEAGRVDQVEEHQKAQTKVLRRGHWEVEQRPQLYKPQEDHKMKVNYKKKVHRHKMSVGMEFAGLVTMDGAQVIRKRVQILKQKYAEDEEKEARAVEREKRRLQRLQQQEEERLRLIEEAEGLGPEVEVTKGQTKNGGEEGEEEDESQEATAGEHSEKKEKQRNEEQQPEHRHAGTEYSFVVYGQEQEQRQPGQQQLGQPQQEKQDLLPIPVFLQEQQQLVAAEYKYDAQKYPYQKSFAQFTQDDLDAFDEGLQSELGAIEAEPTIEAQKMKQLLGGECANDDGSVDDEGGGVGAALLHQGWRENQHRPSERAVWASQFRSRYQCT
jgi:hypothetical protein